jgi:hypothetical protein
MKFSHPSRAYIQGCEQSPGATFSNLALAGHSAPGEDLPRGARQEGHALARMAAIFLQA